MRSSTNCSFARKTSAINTSCRLQRGAPPGVLKKIAQKSARRKDKAAFINGTDHVVRGGRSVWHGSYISWVDVMGEIGDSAVAVHNPGLLVQIRLDRQRRTTFRNIPQRC